MKKVTAIIQARMTSTRCPGKCMKRIRNKPLIGYLLERISQCSMMEHIILATTLNRPDDVLCDYVKKAGFDVFRGSEDDVLERYFKTAMHYQAMDIMRITGDCPLIDPEICDNLVSYYFENKLDYAYLSPRFAEGLDCEAFSYAALKKAHENAKETAQREHVTLFFPDASDHFKIGEMDNDVDDSSYRITVDNEEDFIVVKHLIKSGLENNAFSEWANIKSYLDKHPEIKAINSHIIRNEGLIKSLRSNKELK